MKTFLQTLTWVGVLSVGSLGLGASQAKAQGFGFSYASPGFSVGVGRPAYYAPALPRGGSAASLLCTPGRGASAGRRGWWLLLRWPSLIMATPDTTAAMVATEAPVPVPALATIAVEFRWILHVLPAQDRLASGHLFDRARRFFRRFRKAKSVFLDSSGG